MYEPLPTTSTNNKRPTESNKSSNSFIEWEDNSPWRSRFDLVYREIRRRIVLLEYQPDTKLNIIQLSNEFAISRTPIRSVIQRLEREGLVLTRHGVGTIVTAIIPSQSRDAMQMRLHLATLIGEVNPKLPCSNDLQKIQVLKEVTETKKTLSSSEAYSYHADLHDFKCGLIGSELLHRTYDEMYYRTVRVWFYHLNELDWETEMQSMRSDISQTFFAAKRGDIPAVGFITRNAISAQLHRLNSVISKES